MATMESNPLEGFTLFFGLTEAVGALALILVAIWMGSYRGGFAWTSKPSIQFNWHPLLMTVGMIFLYGNAILLYRAFRNSRKRKLKIAHAAINAVAFLLSVIGLQAVFDSHNLANPPIPNMYSLHSWLGLASVILFACQWLLGLIAFLYPTLSAPLRSTYYPVHVYFGMNAFVCAAAAALIGLTEKNFCGDTYSKFSSEGLLVNFIGVSIIIFSSLVIHLVSATKYKRQPLPEDEMLLTSNEAGKELHGKHWHGYVDKDSNKWLIRAGLYGETEGFMVAIQDQVIATWNYRKHILKDPNVSSDVCRRQEHRPAG